MSSPFPPPDTRRLIGIGAAIAVAYVFAAWLGFRVAVVAEQVTTVWAPTGIGIAALLLWGRALWPAVWLGAFVANAATDAPLWTAVVVATGNTLESVVAVSMLRRLRQFSPTFSRIQETLAFIILAAGLSTAVSATIGAATLCVAGVQPWTRFAALWTDWWIGDALGALVVAPVILSTARRWSWSRRELLEGGLLVAGGVLATEIVFGQWFGPTRGNHPLEYVTFPFVIAAAVRARQPVTALVVLGASIVTIWNTALGAGPFASGEMHQSLVLLQAFMAVMAGTGLLLAAAIAERETGERRRAAAHAVGELLADAPTLASVAPSILRAICGNLDWQIGALWLVDAGARQLRCFQVWHEDRTPMPAFAAVTLDTVLPRGVGLPGRVWASGKAVWIEDVLADANFARQQAARDAGLHGAFGFPVCLGDEVLGVVECFNRTIVAPDADLLSTMSTLGNQIGQFIGRKREESAVVDVQRRTTAILDRALDAVVGMDHRGLITDFNPAAVRTFGYSREDAIGRELAELLVPPALRRQHREGLERYLASGVGPFIDQRVETTAYHADGHEFPVEVSIMRVTDNEPPRFTGFIRDLTMRVQAEREREQLLLSEATARKEAEAANRAKDEFLATLSHELRTPLNAIVGWTRMLLDGTLDGSSSRRALEVIDRNAHLQVQLVADILDVSRIITGGLRLDLRPVDVAAVIGAALDAVRPAADAKRVRLRPRLLATGRLLQADPQRLQQVFWNLLANAVKFTAPGGTVTIDLLDAAGQCVQIKVQDDGAGIDPAFLPYVFDRFRQADGSVSRQHGGLGLGLAIVRHLVEVHGGTVRAESAGLGLGSTFTVELPGATGGIPGTTVEDGAASTAAASSETPAEDPADVLAGRRILIVDDQPESREVLTMMLTFAGAEVDVADSVDDALRKLEASRPDVLLADIGMPGKDGYALVRAVRAMDARTGRRLPVAATTAYASALDRQRALDAGFDGHVPKPIIRSALIELVRTLCEGARP
ncbi:MAG TPA: MASE1 domain-containing protein [Vicinamibacterales bacterium]|nr:MASE1 domain-containing protein [Vicinamibacterales bacterium]